MQTKHDVLTDWQLRRRAANDQGVVVGTTRPKPKLKPKIENRNPKLKPIRNQHPHSAQSQAQRPPRPGGLSGPLLMPLQLTNPSCWHVFVKFIANVIIGRERGALFSRFSSGRFCFYAKLPAQARPGQAGPVFCCGLSAAWVLPMGVERWRRSVREPGEEDIPVAVFCNEICSNLQGTYPSGSAAKNKDFWFRILYSLIFYLIKFIYLFMTSSYDFFP